MKKILEVKIEVPLTPSYLRYGDRKTLHISEFSEEELKQIGKEWTAELIRRSKKKEIKTNG
jgi:hypothetical protein